MSEKLLTVTSAVQVEIRERFAAGYESLVILTCDELPHGLAVLVDPSWNLYTPDDWMGVQPSSLDEKPDFSWLQVADSYERACDGFEGFPVSEVLNALGC